MNAVEETREAMANKLNFPELYEKIISEIQEESIRDPVLLKVLKDKRDFGLAKYGPEISFQGSFENAMASPTIKHACEELIDAMNYVAHQLFKDGSLYQGENSEALREIFDNIYQSYCDLNDIRDE
jgi:hypothetical protein